jgi:hypothetical protein
MSKSPRKDTNGKCTGSSFGDALLLLVRFAAYSKFAHPDPETHNPGIPFPIFDRIFKSLCVQYFPHEHLDRPECKYSYGKQSELDWGAEFIRRYRKAFS